MVMHDRQGIHTQTGSRMARLGALTHGTLTSLVIAMSLALGAMLDSRPAAAQTACGDRADILDNLENVHSETPRAMGLSADGAVLKILVSSDGNWTILVTYPNRVTCLVAAGGYWESVPLVAFGPRV